MKDAKEAKEIILKATLDELAEVGIGKARTSSIAKRAGVTTGLLHYHFGTKENLIREMIKNSLDTSILDEVTVIPFYRECTPVEKIQIILYSIIKYNISRSHNIIKLFHRFMAAGKEFINNLVVDYNMSIERYIIKIIEQGNKEKVFDVKYPSYFSLDLMHSPTYQMSMYFLFEENTDKEYFFPSPFKETYSDYFINTNLRKIINFDKLKKIPEIPEDLKQIIDTYIDVINNKRQILSWHIIVMLIIKLFNDEDLFYGEN